MQVACSNFFVSLSYRTPHAGRLTETAVFMRPCLRVPPVAYPTGASCGCMAGFRSFRTFSSE